MKLEDFNINVASEVMKLWREHLGSCHNNVYLKYPGLLASRLKTPDRWVVGRFEDIIGSKYARGSTLLAYLRHERLEIGCYFQANGFFGDGREAKEQEAREAGESFNKAVREYLETVDKT